MKYSVIIPAHNEEQNVSELGKHVQRVMDRMTSDWEILFIDDGSSDKTFDRLVDLRIQEPRIKIIRFLRNFGQSLAWQAGFDHANGDVIISMDADLQNDPEDIPAMVTMLERENYDAVSGWRMHRKDDMLLMALSALGNGIRRFLTGDSTHDHGCSLKAYKKRCLEGLNFYNDLHRRYITAILHWKGYRVGEMKVRHHRRKHGMSHYSIRRKWRGLLDLLVVKFWIRYSTNPIHLFGTIGILLSAAGGILGGTLGVMRIFQMISLQNRTSPLLAVLLVILGVQFFLTGFLADFMSKGYYASTRAYTIDKKIGLEE